MSDRASPAPALALAGLIAVFFAVAAALFAARQAVWLDEATQLSGLALPFGEQFRWLTGRSDAGIEALADRTPPLSYWLGGLWARLFGFGEESMRAFGIACALLAAPAIWKTGRLAGGAGGGLLMLALTLASPGIVQIAGEIRAYPLFLLLSSLMVWAFARIVLAPEGRAPRGGLLLYSVLAVATSYAHFYGLVAAGALFAGLLVHALAAKRGRAAGAIVLAGLATLLAASGILPFVLHATAMELGGEPLLGAVSGGRVWARLAQLCQRLLAHPVMLVAPPLLWIAGAATIGLLGLALHRLREPDGRGALLALSTPLAVAFPTLVALNFAIRGFEVMAWHYNLWMAPVLALVCASSLGSKGRARRAAVCFALAAGLANAAGSALLVSHARLFSHGPGEWVAARLEAPAETLLVLDAADPWRHVRDPVAWLTGGATAFRLRGAEGAFTAPVAETPRPLAYEVRIWRLGHRALAAIARGEADCAPPEGLKGAGEGMGAESFCAYVSASMWRLEPDSNPDSPPDPDLEPGRGPAGAAAPGR